MNFGAHRISTEAKQTGPEDSSGHVEEKKASGRHVTAARQQSRKHSQHRNETPKEYDGAPKPKKKISANQQSIAIEADVVTVFVKKGQTNPPSDQVSGTVPDDRTRCGRQYDDDDVDLTRQGVQLQQGLSLRGKARRHFRAQQY